MRVKERNQDAFEYVHVSWAYVREAEHRRTNILNMMDPYREVQPGLKMEYISDLGALKKAAQTRTIRYSSNT